MRERLGGINVEGAPILGYLMAYIIGSRVGVWVYSIGSI